jgi:tellurium resistance protein TerD
MKGAFMAISLAKGQSVDVPLVPGGTTPVNVWVGVGWEPAEDSSPWPHDLDVQAFVLGSDGKALSEDCFVFYGNLSDPSGAIEHAGDEQVGVREGDDERILVRLGRLPDEAERVVFTVSIHEAVERGQHFGEVDSAYARMIDYDTAVDIAEFPLTEGFPGATCVLLAGFARTGDRWRFEGIGEPAEGSLADVVRSHGLEVVD